MRYHYLSIPEEMEGWASEVDDEDFEDPDDEYIDDFDDDEFETEIESDKTSNEVDLKVSIVKKDS